MVNGRIESAADIVARECVAVRVRMLNRVITRIYNAALRPFDLTISQMSILVAVTKFGQAKQQDVSQVLDLEKSTLSRDIQKMKENGWLEVTPGQDARISLLQVTPSGRRLLKQAFPGWRNAQDRVIEMLGPEQFRSVERMLVTLRGRSFI